MDEGQKSRRTVRAVLAVVFALVATVAGAVVSSPAQAASCHASGYACLYADNGFLKFQDDFRADRALPSGWNNTMSSFRNRTTCAVRLYDSAGGTGKYVTVPAHTEVRSLGNKFGKFWNDRVSFLDFCP
ncbi:peptidase inhibitor family I36 protein [Actinoplanes sp. NPDC051494]|uniref:peptidase inhibitor family I36 protein n=1 Tax=Actinoplanes sp. NPDC051494 TaxID=3363907 RepID=UPI0037BC0BD9